MNGGARCLAQVKGATMAGMTKTSTGSELRARLGNIAVRYHRAGRAVDRAREQHAVATDALKAVQAKLGELLAQAEAKPNAWFDDIGCIAATLADLL